VAPRPSAADFDPYLTWIDCIEITPDREELIPRAIEAGGFKTPERVLTEMDRGLRRTCEDAASPIGVEVEAKEFWYFRRLHSAPISSPR
jgi:hypothetical protein